MKKDITCMVVGAGGRGKLYAKLAVEMDDQFKIVAVAEPDESRRKEMSDLYKIPAKNQFKTWQDAAAQGKIADCVINGTMDMHHRDSAVAFFEQGYDMLLEKPLAPNLNDSLDIINSARKNQRKVVLGFVLRYTPFYTKVKEIVDSGRLGRIMQIRMSENVGWLHYSSSFVRNQFRRAPLCSSFLVQKSCHDTDIMAWLMGKNKPVRVSSFGSLKYFTKENKPPGATEYCLDGCPLNGLCLYSSDLKYVSEKWWREEVLKKPDMTDDEVRAHYRHTPEDKCVYQNDNTVNDRQALLVEFEDNALGIFDMHGFDMRGDRLINIYGQQGNLEGSMHDNIIKVRVPKMKGGKVEEEIIDLKEAVSAAASGHGGGDRLLTRDFINAIRHDADCVASIYDAEVGHRIAFAADKSSENGGIATKVWD
ncbi:MAG: Gfo/Idh/MocA family oxidoreductase [Planctomycetota bacterium]